MPPKHIAFAILLFALLACSGDNTVTYGGQTYKTVKIGEQVWFAENLNYEVEGSVCYDNNPDNCAKYGRLYNWETAMKVCPEGWHLPSNEEWKKLFSFVEIDTDSYNPDKISIAGEYLKAKNNWKFEEDGPGTDDYGFSALPGGYGDPDGSFVGVGYYGHWWTSTDGESSRAYYKSIYYGLGDARWHSGDKSYLSSARCVQN
jgi:uncharacterized protein (TIGR02145 family)